MRIFNSDRTKILSMDFSKDVPMLKIKDTEGSKDELYEKNRDPRRRVYLSLKISHLMQHALEKVLNDNTSNSKNTKIELNFKNTSIILENNNGEITFTILHSDCKYVFDFGLVEYLEDGSPKYYSADVKLLINWIESTIKKRIMNAKYLIRRRTPRYKNIDQNNEEKEVTNTKSTES